MSIYLEQIKQLIALQQVDDEIFVLEQELKNAPEELNSLQKKFSVISERKEQQEEKMLHLAEQEKRLGIEIEDEAARIKKSKSKLMQVANSKEYHAMVREMDSLEKMNKDREEEKLALIDEVLLQKRIQKEINEEFGQTSEDLKNCEAHIQERLDKANAELSKLQKERAAVSSGVPAPIFSRYEFIRKRLSHPVIVPVSDKICAGCNIAIPPQSYIELQKGVQILSCPNCQRLIFWCDHFPESKKSVESPIEE